MKRIKLSLLIVITIISVSIWNLFTIQTRYHELLSLAEQTGVLIKEGDKDAAIDMAHQTENYWEDLQDISSLLIHNEKIVNIHASVARIAPLIEEDSDEAYAELQVLKEQINRLCDTEMPNIYNIF